MVNVYDLDMKIFSISTINTQPLSEVLRHIIPHLNTKLKELYNNKRYHQCTQNSVNSDELQYQRTVHGVSTLYIVNYNI